MTSGYHGGLEWVGGEGEEDKWEQNFSIII